MRKETVYPTIAAGLANCTNASVAWNKIQSAIDKLDNAMIENIWDHCYIKCGYEQTWATRYWGWRAFYHSGESWA